MAIMIIDGASIAVREPECPNNAIMKVVHHGHSRMEPALKEMATILRWKCELR